ncbi:MAG: hypothetical protein RBR81_12440 [Bacteroidales bacterium]|jgi:hypothetical protein|nr:hypothetical protein [Bacteroidales bacterium]
MKNIIAFLLFNLIILAAASGQNTSLKPFGIKSGIIDYSYSGDKVGKGTLYFDDFGMKSAMYTDAVEDGEKRRGWVVSYGDYQYIWDPDASDEGMKLKNPIIAWIAESSKGDIESFTESMYSKMGFTKVPDEMFLGKTCKVMKGKMGKVLTWNGILMMLDMNVMGIKSLEEATKVQINTPVDPKYFNIPRNITFSEMPVF